MLVLVERVTPAPISRRGRPADLFFCDVGLSDQEAAGAAFTANICSSSLV